MSGGGRNGGCHYRSIPPAKEQLDAFKPGDEVDYHVDRRHTELMSVPAIVVRITSKRVVVRVMSERRVRGVHPENLSKRGS